MCVCVCVCVSWMTQLAHATTAAYDTRAMIVYNDFP